MELKTKVLEAALQVFAEVGYRGATTRRIAQVAGVNEVTLFRHFGSKDELMRAAMQYASAEDVHPRLPEVPVDPERELTEWAAAHHTRMLQRGPIIRTCLSEQLEHPDMAKCMCDGPARISAELRTYMKRLIERGFVPPEADTSAAIAVFMSALFTDAITRDQMGHLYSFPPEDAPARYARIVLAALGVRTTASTTTTRKTSYA